MVAKNTHNIYQYLNDRDPNEVKIALNEIVNLLYNEKKTFSSITYWYLWLKKITMSKKKSKKDFICKEYDVEGIPCHLRTDWVWPLWNIIIDYSNKQKSLIKKFIGKLYSSYINKYKGFNSGYKQYILFFCFYICTNDLNLNVKIRQKEHFIIQAQANINKMYGSIEEKFICNYDYHTIKKRKYRTDSILTSYRKKNEQKMIKENIKVEDDIDDDKKLEEEVRQIRKEERMAIKIDALSNFIPTKKKEENLPIKHYFANTEQPKKTINFNIKSLKKKRDSDLYINKNQI